MADQIFTPPADWPVVFEDDFTKDTKLDQTKWYTRYIETGPDGPGTLDFLNDEWQRYRETGNHVFSADGIGLTALTQQAAPPSTAAGEYWYPSGMLRAKDLFPIADGRSYYFEVESKMPPGKGGWGALWLSGSARVPDDVMTVRWPPEIDFMEIVNNANEDTLTMLGVRCQVLDWDNNPQNWSGYLQQAEGFNPEFGSWYAPFDFSVDFHRFGLLYKRPDVAFYCDGNLVAAAQYDWVWDDRTDAPPANLLLDLAIGGNWAGRYGVDDSALPMALQIKYARVWRSPKSAVIPPQPEPDDPLPRCPIGKDYVVT